MQNFTKYNYFRENQSSINLIIFENLKSKSKKLFSTPGVSFEVNSKTIFFQKNDLSIVAMQISVRCVVSTFFLKFL